MTDYKFTTANNIETAGNFLLLSEAETKAQQECKVNSSIAYFVVDCGSYN